MAKKQKKIYPIIAISLILGFGIGLTTGLIYWKTQPKVEIWTVRNPERIPYCSTVGREHPFDEKVKEFCNY